MSAQEIIRQTKSADVTVEQVGSAMLQMEGLLRNMAATLAATNARITELEKELRQLTPISQAQEKALADRIKARAQTLQEARRLPIRARALIAKAIRRDLKRGAGVSAMRDLPRVDYALHQGFIDLWDDYTTMRLIRAETKEDKP